MPGTIVNATLTGTDTTRTVTSDKDGAFDIPELAVGSYDVSADAQGFKKFVAKDVMVTIGHVNFITVTLQIGGGNQTVTVEANAVQVETTSTQLGGVMTEQSIRELPSARATRSSSCNFSRECNHSSARIFSMAAIIRASSLSMAVAAVPTITWSTEATPTISS